MHDEKIYISRCMRAFGHICLISIYCRVIYNSFEYEDEHPYSLAKEGGPSIGRQQDIADMLEKKKYSGGYVARLLIF